MLTLTRDELIDEATEAMCNRHDQDVQFRSYAEAVVDRLIALGMRPAREANAPCAACGKPADTLLCSKGGCPLGADL